MRRIQVLLVVVLAGGTLLGLGFYPRAAMAASVMVGSSGQYPCDRQGLADAIDAAGDGGTVTFDCDPAIIQFDASNSQIVITYDITIDGSNNGNPIVLDGNDETRFFNVSNLYDSHLSLSHMTLQHGHDDSQGGAINLDAHGSLTVIDVTFRDNHSNDASGAVGSDSSAVTIQQSAFIHNTVDGAGGAIYSDGMVTIDQSAFSNNISQAYGGVIYNNTAGTLIVSQSTFANNSTSFDGGAIDNNEKLTVSQSSFVDNTAEYNRGAIDLYSGSAQIIFSTFTGNKAPYGSAIYVAAGFGSGQVSWSTIVQPLRLNRHSMSMKTSPSPVLCLPGAAITARLQAGH